MNTDTRNHKRHRLDSGHDYARIARTAIEAAALALLVYHVWYAAWRLI